MWFFVQCHVGLTIYQLSDLLQSKKEKMVALLGEGCSTVTQPIAHATPLWNLALVWNLFYHHLDCQL